ncbi:MAG: GNAT family N-acetyltransferase [Planctomycetaceae bacterium]|nr:GNAT family N-acetyltransferase [Planctomycetaceae bacterium]
MQVSIRPYTLADAPALFEAARESVAEVHLWLPWCHAGYQADDAQTWIKSQIEALANRTAYAFLIEDDAGRFLGGCGLNQINDAHRLANLGYWVRTSAAGQGIAPRAVRLVAEWALANTNLQRLEIVVAVSNTRSHRVAEKAGALREGVLRSRLFVHNQPHDAVMYSIVRPEA